MDFQVSQKEEISQPDGLVDVYVPDVFDIYPEFAEDGITIINALIVDALEDTKQAALFASVRQRGSDPMNPEAGVRWAETMIGELSPDTLVADIKNAVRSVSTNCTVDFNTVSDANGVSYLTYDIKVAP
jgi:hypothetical protein